MPDSFGRSANDAFAIGVSQSSSRDLFFGSLTRWRLILAAQMVDFAVIFIVAMILYPMIDGAMREVPLRYILGTVAVAVISHASFFQAHLYDLDALVDEVRTIKTVAVRWTWVFVSLAAFAALIHQPSEYSRLWFVGFYGGGAIGLAVGRTGIAMIIRHWIGRGYHTQSVAIIGSNELAEQLISRFEANPFGIRIVGVFDDRGRDGVKAIRGVPKLGGIADLLDYTKNAVVDTVIITLPITGTERLNDVIRQLRQQPLNVRVLPGPIGLERLSPIRLARTELPGVQLIAVADRPISELALVTKNVFDRAAAAVAILLLAPVLLACAAGIAVASPGPVLFRQKRVGYKGREFEIIKFRTMHFEFCGSHHPTVRNDARVFKFGSLLRKLSLDELPQLFNVLKGDMSLVGPRPHMIGQSVAGRTFFDAVNEYATRHRVKPGITGWAQVNGWRGPAETVEQIERRVEYDTYYIENWSLMFDFLIIFRTILVGFFGKNAF